LRGAPIIVLIPRDVILLPVAIGDFQDSDCPCRAAKAVACPGRDPEFITYSRMVFDVVHLYDGSRIENDPEFRTAGVRLKAESLPWVDRHEAHGDFLIMGVLTERSPRADNASY